MKIISNIMKNIKFEISIFTLIFKLLFNRDDIEIGSKWKTKQNDTEILVEILNVRDSLVDFKFTGKLEGCLPQTVSKDVFLMCFSKYK